MRLLVKWNSIFFLVGLVVTCNNFMLCVDYFLFGLAFYLTNNQINFF
jgi:hypothetical protein